METAPLPLTHSGGAIAAAVHLGILPFSAPLYIRRTGETVQIVSQLFSKD